MASKNILGLDLGTTSVGFAHVIEDDVPEQSEIVQIGTRIIQYDNFDRNISHIYVTINRFSKRS